MVGIRDYSPTADANLSVAGISIAEGWARASVNNALRAQLADIANLLLDQGGGTVTTGSSNAYLLNLPTAPTAYADNLAFVCKLNHSVTGAATININGIGVKPLKKLVAGVATALSAGDGYAGDRATCIYSSADNCVLLLNSQAVFTNTGGETWPITDRMKEQVYLLDFIPQSEHAAIRNGTSTFDCSDAMDDAMAAISVPVVDNTAYEGGPEVIFPYGQCYFSRTIEINKTMILTGYGQGGRTSWSTRLLFAPNITGITVNSFNTYGGGVVMGIKGGNSTTIRHLRISSQSNGVPNHALNETGFGVGHGIGHGIWCRARANIEHCTIQWFPQHGIYVRAVSGAEVTFPELAGNANNMYVSHVTCIENGGCGLYIDGPDTNAGLFMAMDLSNNRLSAIHESSSDGNVHIMPHTAANGLDAISSYAVTPGVSQSKRYYCRDAALAPTIPPEGDAQSANVWGFIMNSPGAVGAIDATYPVWPAVYGGSPAYRLGYNFWFDQVGASNTLIGPYTEGGQPFSLIRHLTLVVGGLSYDAASTGSEVRAGTSNALIQPGLSIPARSTASIDYLTSINRVAGEAFSLQVAGDGNPVTTSASALCYIWDNTNGTWMIQHAGSAARIAQRFTTGLNTLTGGRAAAVGAGNTMFTQGLWLGRATIYARHLSMAEVVPTTGQWAAGDYVLNATPTGVGSILGWRCITSGDFAGTPPVFQAIRPSTSQQSIADIAFTLTPATSPYHTLHTGSLTAARAATLSTAGATSGMTFRITRTSGNTGGPWSLNVGTGPLIALATNRWCDVTFDGAAYYLSAFGSLAVGDPA